MEDCASSAEVSSGVQSSGLDKSLTCCRLIHIDDWACHCWLAHRSYLLIARAYL